MEGNALMKDLTLTNYYLHLPSCTFIFSFILIFQMDFFGKRAVRKNESNVAKFHDWVKITFVKNGKAHGGTSATVAQPPHPSSTSTPSNIRLVDLKSFLSDSDDDLQSIPHMGPADNNLPFDLFNELGDIRPPTLDERAKILKLIPGAWSVKVLPPHLIIVTDELSTLENLPGSIAGLACYYTDNHYDNGPLGASVCYGARMYIPSEQHGGNPDLRTPTEKMTEYLGGLKDMKVRALAWVNRRWIMFHDDLTKEEVRRLPACLGGTISVAVPWSITRHREFKRLAAILTSEEHKCVPFPMVTQDL